LAKSWIFVPIRAAREWEGWQASLRSTAVSMLATGSSLLCLNYDFLRKDMKAVQSIIMNNCIAASPLLPLSQVIPLTNPDSFSLTAA